jgi:hypothetical protein
MVHTTNGYINFILRDSITTGISGSNSLILSKVSIPFIAFYQFRPNGSQDDYIWFLSKFARQSSPVAYVSTMKSV